MNKEFLYALLNSNSVSGSETEIEKKIYDHMKPIADTVTVDKMDGLRVDKLTVKVNEPRSDKD